MHLTIVGCGYVGLVSGACFSDFGHTVTCIDNDLSRVEALRRGESPIFEPGLDELIQSNVRGGRLSFGTNLAEAVKGADAVFIAVGTPSRGAEGVADLSYVHQAAAEIADAILGETIIVNKSTAPVGTGDDIEAIVRQRRPDFAGAVVSNPEFLREGDAIADFKRPDRVIVGTDDPRAREVMTEIYRPLELNNAPLIFMNRRTAEMTKYAANAFLVTKISFINEFADFCEKTGANVQDVARGIGLDNRIGPKFLNAGPGYGGSCFPKDTAALIHSAEKVGAPLRIIETVVKANEERKLRMAGKVIEACGGSIVGKTVAVLGLAFKANTDDMRGAPSLAIVQALQKAGATIKAYDPASMTQARGLLSGIMFSENAYDCASGADAVVVLTEWDEFRARDLARRKTLLAAPGVGDLRNIYRPEDMRRRGFVYSSVGRE